MSQEDTLSRRDRKALRDAERQKKGKKRKHDETEEPEAVPTCDAHETTAESVKPKESKKRKSASEGDENVAADNATTEEPPKKKRRRKGTSEDEKPSKNRFIVFVGNLPYKTTDSSLDKHFVKLKPFTLRHRTDPKTKKSKGFAFLEFENYDRMKTCLKLYHHSMFDPEAIECGEAPIEPGTGTESLPDQNAAFKGRHHKKKETARRINVELTAGGGGGNSEERKEKIKVKNAKLDEERKRRAEEERKVREKEAKKDAKAGKKQDKVKGEKKTTVKELQEKANKGEEEVGAGEEDSHGMHPSRMRMLHR